MTIANPRAASNASSRSEPLGRRSRGFSLSGLGDAAAKFTTGTTTPQAGDSKNAESNGPRGEVGPTLRARRVFGDE
jgi:hypothetical protein